MTTKPKIITLCGSTRFPQAFELANMHLSMLGHIVISLGCFGHTDMPTGAKFLTSDGDEATPEKQALDQLHFRKIDLCDEIFVVNVGGYVGTSTTREIAYAESLGKRVRYMFPKEDERSALPSEAWPWETKFRLMDRVRKVKGGSWQGRVVGFYATHLTTFGYAVESEREPGSVQIYPEAALELVPEGQP